MSRRYKGAVISGTAPTISNLRASGIWTLRQNFQSVGNQWPEEVLVPAPTFYLKFSDSIYLDSRITFSRNGPATYFDQNGTLITAGNDTFRLDHDPRTGENIGLLIESPQTNLCLRSEEFQTLWSGTNVSVTANTIQSLDEVNAGDSILETSSTGEHYLQQNITCDSITNRFSFSVFVKSINRSKGYLKMSIFAGVTHSVLCDFDLVNKTVSTSVTGASEVVSSKILECRDGWFRISCTGLTGQSGTHSFSLGIYDDSGNNSYAGNTSNGFYAWGYQVEQGNFASSYIRTFGTTQSRIGDVVTMSGSNFSSWFNLDQGTVYIRTSPLEIPTSYSCLFEISDTTANEKISCFIDNQTSPPNKIAYRVIDGGINQSSIESSNEITDLGSFSAVVRYKSNDFKLAVDGEASALDNSGSLPAVTTLNIGTFLDSASGFFNGHITDLFYWNYNLNDEQLRIASSTSYSDDKSLILEFDKMLILDSRITFSRLSDATYFNSSGILSTVSSNEPRIDHDPSTGENLGLLIEETRTNLLTYSEQLDNAAWIKSSVTVTANATTAPDGTNSADLILEDANVAAHQIVISESINSETNNFSASVFVKAAGRTKGSITINSNNNYFSAEFDLTQETTTQSSSGTGVAASSNIIPLINDWYRITLTGRTGQNGVTSFIVRLDDDTVNLTYLGDNTKGLYVWGAQLEEGEFSSSYIRTGANQYTREDDVAFLAGVNFSDWFNPSSGSFYWKGSMIGLGKTNQTALSVSDGTIDEKITLFGNFKPTVSDNKISRLLITNDSTDIVTLDSPALFEDTVIDFDYEITFGYETNNFTLSLGNNEEAVSNLGTLPSVDRINIGSDHTGGNLLNGHIKKIYYWNSKRPNWALATLKNKT